MPFHEKFKRDEDGKIIEDENGPIVLLEGTDYSIFPKNFLAETKQEADNLYKKYLKTLSLLALRHSEITGLDREDFLQEGIIGLARASRDFDKNRGENSDFNTFAIYKIKDAMREFATSQSTNTKTPQYIKDSFYLINKLRRIVESTKPLENKSLINAWDVSEKYEQDSEISDSVREIRQSIYNLAERSCVDVKELIKRAELSPVISTELTSRTTIENMSSDSDIFAMVSNNDMIDIVTSTLSERELEMMRLYFVNNYTVRDIGEKLNKRASTVTIQLGELRRKLAKRIMAFKEDKYAGYKYIKKDRKKFFG